MTLKVLIGCGRSWARTRWITKFGEGVQFAWMMLPAERKTVAEVERVVRRIVDRAFKNFREDAASFDQGE